MRLVQELLTEGGREGEEGRVREREGVSEGERERVKEREYLEKNE